MQSILTVKFYFFLSINIFIIFIIIIIIKYYHIKLTLLPRQVLLDSMKELRNSTETNMVSKLDNDSSFTQ